MNRLLFFKSINIPTPEESIYKRLGYRKGKTQILPQQKEEIERYIEDALSFIELKGAGILIPVQGVKASRVVLSTRVTFKSTHLASFLKDCQEIVLMGATAGRRITDVIQEDSAKNDLTRAVVFDAVASEIVDALLDWITSFYNQKLRRKNRHLTSTRFSAGYHDFLLENQKIIYNILQLQRIGININENFILTPEKSVTAVAGVKSMVESK